MTYRICYHRPAVATAGPGLVPRQRIEEYATEHEALGRARQLLDAGDRHAVSVDDGAGNVLCGLRLHLKLGYADQ